MSIKSRIAVILSALFACLLLLDAGVLYLTVSPGFDELERREARNSMMQARDAILADLSALDILNADWAAWDDTYNYVTNPNKSYEQGNLIEETFTGAKLNLIVILDEKGRQVWGTAFDLETEKAIRLKAFPDQGLAAGHPLLNHPTATSAITGFINTGRGAMLTSSRPIITSRETGPIRGTIIMGRILDNKQVKLIAQRLHLNLSAKNLNGQSILPEGENLSRLPKSGEILVRESGHIEHLDSFLVLDDLFGKPSILLHVDLPHYITKLSNETFTFALILLLLTAAAVMIALQFLLQGYILNPLHRMTGHITQLGQPGHSTDLLPESRHDELGVLARSFNRMQERILRLAHKDSLTGLTNRTLFLDRVEQILKLMRRQKGLVALYFLDLDGFKEVNDTLGHHTGDLLLQAIARRLQSALREIDTIARIGGDEFTIITLGFHNHDEIIQLGDKVVDLFQEPFDVNGHKLSISASIGISIYPDDAEDVDSLMKNADIAMYRAKNAGKNTYRIFSNDAPAPVAPPGGSDSAAEKTDQASP